MKHLQKLSGDTISEGGKMGKVIELPPRIRVISLPKASALTPVNILQGFIGVEFPVEEIVPLFVRHGKTELFGYAVDKRKALRILRRTSPDTADYIEKHPEIFTKPHLVFNENVCERVGFYRGKKEK